MVFAPSAPSGGAHGIRALYELRDLEVCLGGRLVLKAPQLSLPEGSVTAVVGPNGAGKTTLLRLLAFLLEPTRGEVVFRGERVEWRERALVPLRRAVTLVMQDPYLFHGSVAGNVAYGVRGIGRSERRLRVAGALGRVGLGGLGARAARGLSGGETRRVAIARALALEPRVLLLDEPMAGVDAGSVATIEEVIAVEGARPGRTVIFTTHDLPQAYRCAEKVLSLLEGSIAPFALTNLFRGRMGAENGMPFFDTGRLRFAVPYSRPGVRFLALDPEAVLLSREPVRSSARNVFAGIVRSVEAEGECCRVTVDCGEPIVALVTLRSWTELGLRPGERVHLAVKSTALHLH